MKSSSPTLSERFVACARARPDKVAMTLLTTGHSEDMTFGVMLEQVCSVAYRLIQGGISSGDRVAIIGENHPNWAIAYLGILHRGAVATPLDPTASAKTLATFLSDSESKLAFVSNACLNKFREACAFLGRNIPLVLLEPSTEIEHVACFSDWVNAPISERCNIATSPVDSTDLALLIYTSGTTARPKGVPLSHGNIQAQINAVEEIMRVTDNEVVFSILPLFHAYSQIINLWLAATIGARVVYLNQLGFTEIKDGLKQSSATVLIGVPILWYFIHQRIFESVNAQPTPVRWLLKMMMAANGALRDYAHFNLGPIIFRPVHRALGGQLRLAVSGGATFDRGVAKDLHRLGFTILQGYGLTETSGAVTATRFEDNRIGSVGKPFGKTELKLNEQDAAGIGEVFIRGPSVMKGYYNNEDDTVQAFTPDGWFRSGDLGYIDKQGHLYIVGRKKDTIVLPSGKNVFPEDVESHYQRSPLITEICVIGRRNTTGLQGAERLCAVVVPDFDYLREKHIGNAGELIRWELENLGRELPEYQRVHDFVLRTKPLPRTATRKIRRFELHQELDTVTAWERAGQNKAELALSEADWELMNSPAGRAVSAILNEQIADPQPIHPLHNLEVDFRLDSLSRVECITKLEHALGIVLSPEESTSAYTVGELVELANQKVRIACALNPATSRNNQRSDTDATRKSFKTPWQEILTDSSPNLPELKPLLTRNRGRALVAYLALRLIYLCAKVVFRLEVEGRAVLKSVKPPYLLCPNHQSYIDPLVVGSTLPFRVLEQIIHVGASEYFIGGATSQIARLVKVVPIDPDVHLLRAMQAGAEVLRQGRILSVYPEGCRSFDGELGVLKKGAAILATELNVPIVPVALNGTYRIWPRNSLRLRKAELRISFGMPIETNQLTLNGESNEASYEELTALLSKRICNMLNSMRIK
jgi:long-chain acyl-CoA synthetase